MSEYKEVQIGPKTMGIPVEWDVRKLGDCAEYLNGYPFKPSQWSTEGLPIIRIQNLTGSSNEINHYNGGDLKDRYVVNKGDLLISWSATLGVYIWDGEKAALNQHIFKVRTNGSIDKKFFYFALDQNIEVLKRKIHGSTMKHITKGTFESTLLPLPPLPEQRRIAEILSTVDDAIRKTDEVIEKAERLKKGLMQDLLTKGIGHTEFKEVQIGPKTVEIPLEWDIVRLGDEKYSALTTGGTPSTKNREYWGGKIPWMVSGEIHVKYIRDVEGRITKKGMNDSRAEFIPKDSILVALNGQGKTKGKVAINLKELTVNQSIGAYVLNKNEFDPYFLLHYFSHEYKRIRALAGEGRSGLNLSLLSNIYVPKPPLEEQNKISKSITFIDKKINEEERIKSGLQHLKKGLMQDLLTGKVRVNA